MKNIIFVQDGKGKNKDLLLLDNEESDIDTIEFNNNKENINLSDSINIFHSKSPFYRIFIKKSIPIKFIITGILKEKDHLGRNLGFISFYDGPIKNFPTYLNSNLSCYDLHIEGINSIETKIKLLNLIKKSVIIILIIITLIYIYGKL